MALERLADVAREIELLGVQHRLELPDERLVLTTTLSSQRYELDPRSAYVNAFNGYRTLYKYSSDLVVRVEERATFEATERWAVSGGLTVESSRALPKTFDLEHPYDPDVGSDSQGLSYPSSCAAGPDPPRRSTPRDGRGTSPGPRS